MWRTRYISHRGTVEEDQGEFWNESSDVLGNDMIEIDEAYDIVCRCIGYEEKWIMYMTT